MVMDNILYARPIIFEGWTYSALTAEALCGVHTLLLSTASTTLIISRAQYVLLLSGPRTATTSTMGWYTATTTIPRGSLNGATAVKRPSSSSLSKFLGTVKISIGIQNVT